LKSTFLRNPGPLTRLAIALLLGAAFLVVCVWWTLADLMVSFANDIVTASLVYDQVFGRVTIERIVWFALALLLLHLAFGLLALALARLTIAAAPGFFEGWRLWLIVAWFLVLAAIAWIANASWYPASQFSPDDSWLHASWQGLRLVHAALAALLAFVIALAWNAVRRRDWPRRMLTWVAASAALLLLAGLLSQGALVAARATHAYGVPHVVIIGVDSLRDDFAGAQAEEQLTPHIDAFLNGAHRFSDTTSPLARTYPALVSLLTGRHPVATNARFNLMPRGLVRERDTLGDALQASGYHSVYATDEVRFANFDQTFGFDQLITPPVGASDFMLGKAGDLPLVNLLSPTRIAAWMFPTSHANRAVYVTYRPGNFVSRLDREFVVDQPEFLYVHLTLSHWPYNWAGLTKPTKPQEYRSSFRHAVTEVDRQFDQVMRLLERKGVLANAIVVVLSDHGEALGGPTDSMLRKTGTGDEIWTSLWGHGTSVMSPHQYSVLLAMRGFGQVRLPGTPAVHPWPVTLEDLRPTLQELATGSAPADVDGISLLPFLRDPDSASKLATRVRYTETDFNTPMVLAGNYDESGLIHEGAAYYEIVPETGWVQLRSNRLPELMSQKQRAALSKDSLLAAIPSRTDESVSYLFTDRRSPLPRRLHGLPDPDTEPEAARLWDALHERFPGELAGISHVP
jgi:arylsulfatase A-like enzyme